MCAGESLSIPLKYSAGESPLYFTRVETLLFKHKYFAFCIDRIIKIPPRKLKKKASFITICQFWSGVIISNATEGVEQGFIFLLLLFIYVSNFGHSDWSRTQKCKQTRWLTLFTLVDRWSVLRLAPVVSIFWLLYLMSSLTRSLINTRNKSVVLKRILVALAFQLFVKMTKFNIVNTLLTTYKYEENHCSKTMLHSIPKALVLNSIFMFSIYVQCKSMNWGISYFISCSKKLISNILSSEYIHERINSYVKLLKCDKKINETEKGFPIKCYHQINIE